MSGREPGHFKFYKDEAGEWRWTKYEDANRDYIYARSTEGYVNRSDCEQNARRFGYEGQFLAVTLDNWSLYQDDAGDWRWRRTAENGEIVGAAHRGFSEVMCRGNAVINGYEG